MRGGLSFIHTQTVTPHSLLVRYWSEDEGNARRFPLFVSVDGGHTPTMAFASALNFGANVQLIKNVRDSSRCKQGDGYCNLSVHYQVR